jgi:membrane protease YdiL (CAAX protease family)
VSNVLAEPKESARQGISGAWKYVALAYSIAWVLWIACIQLHAPESMLILGAAGPSLAALILLRRSPISLRRLTSGRILLFLLAIAGCSVILSLYFASRSSSALHFQWDPWTLIPSAAPAWILSSVLSPDQGIRDLVRSLLRFTRWSLVGLLIIPGIVILGELVAHGLHQPLVSPHSHGSATNDIEVALLFFCYNLFFVAGLEEPGWRGCLLPFLQTRSSPLQSTIFVWAAWALWHAPLDFFRPTPFTLMQYLEIRVIFLLPIAIILTWLYNRGQRSLQACAFLHAGMNTFPFVLPYWMPSFALLFVIAGAAVVGDRMWRKPQPISR